MADHYFFIARTRRAEAEAMTDNEHEVSQEEWIEARQIYLLSLARGGSLAKRWWTTFTAESALALVQPIPSFRLSPSPEGWRAEFDEFNGNSCSCADIVESVCRAWLTFALHNKE